MPTQLTNSSLLDERKNYVLTHTPDGDTSWRLNCSKSRLEEFARKGNFYLVLRCNFGLRNEKIFAIPYRGLEESGLITPTSSVKAQKT